MLTIELRAAPLPKPLHTIAVHLYLVAKNNDEINRWELWQTKNAFQKVQSSANRTKQKSTGHIHVNLKGPLEGVGGGPTYHITEWREQEAQNIYLELQRSLEEYQHKNFYLPWPGPNSNTYIATVLKKAKVSTILPPKAIGKDFCGLMALQNLPHFQCNLLTFGASHAKDFVELHALGLTLGFCKLQKKILHPLSKQ